MKTIYLVILLMAVAIMPSLAQKSYQMEVLNLVQVNETEFTFDVRIKNTNPAEPFAIELIQWQFSFNNALMNGGSLDNTFLTYVSGTTDLVGAAIVPSSDYFSTNQVVVQWLTASLLSGAQTTLFNTGDWKRIGTFKVQLRNTGSTAFHNFADLAHSLSFVPGQVIVNWCNYTTSGGVYYRNGAYFEIITNKTLTNSLSSRNLASHCFTGTGDWSATARWNNVTTANANSLPEASSNAIVAGSATVSDARTVKDLTVASGGYLLLNTSAQLTTDNVYNVNTGVSSGVVTLANWNFEGAGTTLAYSADAGITANNGIAPFNTTATFEAFYSYAEHFITGGTRAPFALGFRPGPVAGVQKDWRIQISTMGYQNLKISSKQWSDVTNTWGAAGPGPSQFILQWSSDGSVWTAISGGTINVSNDWTTGVISNLVLPSDINNLTTVYIRWLTNSPKTSSGYSSIDDIQIVGEALPTGILIQSTASGTGSLKHNTAGVEATMQRYIPAAEDWDAWNDGWHFLSSPVAAQAVDPAFVTSPDNSYDFYCWYEQANEWVNYKYVSGTTWETANAIANGLSNITANLLVGKGYMAAYQNTSTKSFSGTLNVADVNISNLTINDPAANRSWHLLGNPYSSALTWSSGWTNTNISGTAKIWNEANRSYSDLSSAGAPIPATNGFMVQVSSGTGSLTIPAGARVHSTQPWYKSSGQSMMLTARNLDNPSAQESVVSLNPLATEGFDLEYDSEYLNGYAPRFFSVAANEHLSTNCLPSLSASTAIPFTFVKNEGSSFRIEAVGTDNLASEVWLLDKKTNTDHNLSINPVYNFTSSAADVAERFILHFGTLSVIDKATELGFNLWYTEGNIRFSSLPADLLSLSLIDMAGREIVTLGKPGAVIVPIGRNVTPGFYLVVITTTDKVIAKRVFVN